MTAPYQRRSQSVPVLVVTDPVALRRLVGRNTAVVRLGAPLHAHAPGTECLACEARGNVRVLLFELQEKLRLGRVEPFLRVVVDATAIDDPGPVAEALVPGLRPAFGLRDHAVAHNFHLESVIARSAINP